MIERTEENRILTTHGRPFWPLNPRPEDVGLNDIASALSKNCRFCGHVREFYSVAQHSYIVSTLVPEEYALCGLLHDASEAYLSDICRPIKPHLSNYYEIEERLMNVIAEVFGFPWPMPKVVKDVDTRLLATEQRDLRDRPTGERDPWSDHVEPYSFEITPWAPETARVAFLRRFKEINNWRALRGD